MTTRPESYVGIVARPAAILLGLAALAWGVRPRPEPPRRVVPAAIPTKAATPPPIVVVPVEPSPVPAAIEPDRAAIARAEAAVDAASRDRGRAEARAAEASQALGAESARAASEGRAARSLARRVRDPAPRIARASSRVEALMVERRALKAEVDALAAAPRPKGKPLISRSPVARPARGDEFHFEIRRDRVAFIDVDRLLERVKADAQLRVRMGDGLKPIAGTVGPVGSFRLRYEMGRALPRTAADLLDSRAASYDLLGWEIVPDQELRGDTFEATRQPASEYARAIGRLSPTHATVTMWVYPDGFGLFRKLRDDLQARGFLVAGRPMPEAMPIRGSPGGSLSAGQ